MALRVLRSACCPKVSDISDAVWLQTKLLLCGSYTEVPNPAQACSSDAQVTVQSGERVGAQPVTSSDLDKDGGLNVRNRRAAEEGGGTEPNVKVRRKGERGHQKAQSKCVES